VMEEGEVCEEMSEDECNMLECETITDKVCETVKKTECVETMKNDNDSPLAQKRKVKL